MTETTSIFVVTSFSWFHGNRWSGRKETSLVDFFHFCAFRLDILYFAATFDRWGSRILSEYHVHIVRGQFPRYVSARGGLPRRLTLGFRTICQARQLRHGQWRGLLLGGFVASIRCRRLSWKLLADPQKRAPGHQLSNAVCTAASLLVGLLLRIWDWGRWFQLQWRELLRRGEDIRGLFRPPAGQKRATDVVHVLRRREFKLSTECQSRIILGSRCREGTH